MYQINEIQPYSNCLPSQDHFAKLKFNYLEQETKDRFLKSLVKDPPMVVEQSDNWEIGTENNNSWWESHICSPISTYLILDRQNREEKQKLKAGKLETTTLKREIATVGKTLYDCKLTTG